MDETTIPGMRRLDADDRWDVILNGRVDLFWVQVVAGMRRLGAGGEMVARMQRGRDERTRRALWKQVGA